MEGKQHEFLIGRSSAIKVLLAVVMLYAAGNTDFCGFVVEKNSYFLKSWL